MANMTSGQQGLLELPDGKVIKDPFLKTTGNYTSADLDALKGLVDVGGNLVPLDQGMIGNLSKYYSKVPGLESYVTGLIGKGSAFGKDQDYVSASKIKNLANKAFQSGVNPQTIEGYSTDLAATNQQITAQQAQQQADYNDWQKAQAGSATDYQLWLQNKQAQLDQAQKANQIINAGQDQTLAEVPPTAGTAQIDTNKFSLTGAMEQLYGGQNTPAGVSSATPYTDMYNQALESSGLDGLQSQLADINNRLAQEQFTYQQRMDYAGAKPVALGVISGRQSEVARQEQEKITFLTNQRAALTDQINTSMNMINTLMKYEMMDYQQAKADYQQQVDNAFKMQQMVADQQTKEANMAMANLKIIQDKISDGTIDYNKMTDEERLQVNKLELAAGFPIGFSGDIKAVIKGDTVLSHNKVEDPDGSTYDYMTVKATDGIIRTIKQYLYQTPLPTPKGSGGGGGGRSGGGGSSSSADQKRADALKYMEGNATYFKNEITNGNLTMDDAFAQFKILSPELTDQEIKDALGYSNQPMEISNEQKATNYLHDFITEMYA